MTDIRPAATLVLARDGEHGVEVLLLQRTTDAVFMPGFYVFPGGAVDQGDQPQSSHLTQLTGRSPHRMNALLGVDQGGVDYAIAALRECFEEAGVLLAPESHQLSPSLRAHARRQIHQGQEDFLTFCEQQNLTLPLDRVTYIGHWITPPGPPRRYDTRFFLAPMPEGQQASHDGEETIDHAWLTPDQALQDHSDGRRLFAPPTLRTLRRMQGFDTVDALFRALDEAAPEPFPTEPWPGRSGQTTRQIRPGEPPYDELRFLDPQRTGTAWCDIRSDRVVTLAPWLRRITAPNAGMMTGPGTNTYLMGDETELAVLDPGPLEEAHLQRVLDAAGDTPIRQILVTHTHPDHSPGSRWLQARTGARLLGQPAPEGADQDQSFVPDRLLHDGDTVQIGRLQLQALHTPGHASNHLCFLAPAERLLFAGDQVMQGSTVVINPPDGDMSAYLRSLERLLTVEMDWLAPGHGFLMGYPHAILDYLLTHRMAREKKVREALVREPGSRLQELVPLAYDDVPKPLQQVGARSLLAHLIKLEREQQVVREGDLWWPA